MRLCWNTNSNSCVYKKSLTNFLFALFLLAFVLVVIVGLNLVMIVVL